MNVSQYLDLYCQIVQIPKERLKNKSRKEDVVYDRKIYYMLGRRLGFKDGELAVMIGFNRTTSIHHTKEPTRVEDLWIRQLLKAITPEWDRANTIHATIDTDGFNNEITTLTLDGIKFTSKARYEDVLRVFNKIEKINQINQIKTDEEQE